MRQLYNTQGRDVSSGEYLVKTAILSLTVIPLFFLLPVTEFNLFLISTLSVIGSGCYDLYFESKFSLSWLNIIMNIIIFAGIVLIAIIIGVSIIYFSGVSL